MQQAMWNLRDLDGFMKVTGVVKESVVCGREQRRKDAWVLLESQAGHSRATVHELTWATEVSYKKPASSKNVVQASTSEESKRPGTMDTFDILENGVSQHVQVSARRVREVPADQDDPDQQRGPTSWHLAANRTSRTATCSSILGAWNEVLAAIQVHIEEMVETRELAVCFPVKMSDQRETRERIERAVVILHRLFVTHTCVATIVLDGLGQFCNRERFTLLCHGISRCRSLKTLRVNAVMDEASYYQKLLIGCLSLEHLEELCFETIRDSENTGNMAILAAVIERNARLATFKVDWLCAATRYTSALLRALQWCQTLSHLSLDVTCFNENESTSFLNILKGNNALKSLRLQGTPRHNYITVNSIATALSNSTTLVTLELLGFRLNTEDAWALAMGLVRVRTMQTLIIEQCMPAFSLTEGHMYAGAYGTRARVSSRIVPYIYIIQQFPRLRCFAFDLLHFSSEYQREFLQVLAATDSPIRVFAAAQSRGYPSELSRNAMETGTASPDPLESSLHGRG
ncbi:hypothetical protein MTO96_003792 [Rhipicephalus appendiculatus]